MQRNTLFSILATAALGLVMAGPVSAKTTNWTSGDATNPEKWHDEDNWSNGIPAATDTVNINPFIEPDNYEDPVLSTANGAAGTLTIGSDFSLTVTGRTLILDDNSYTFNGPLILSDSTAKVEFTYPQASGWIAVGGSAGITGQDNAAEVRLNDAKINSNTVFRGQMIIKKVAGTSTFLNGSTGIVRADAAGEGSPAILLLKSGLTIDDADTGTPKWEATTDPDAVLQFDVGASCLDGNFVISGCATLRINDVTIATQGTYTLTAGRVDIVGSGEFHHTCNSDCTSCTEITTDQCSNGAGDCGC